MSQARTFEPTPRKLAEARKRGRPPQSRDLVSASAVLAAALVFWQTGAWMVGRLKEGWAVALEAVRAGEHARLGSVLYSCTWLGVQAIAPLLGAVVVAVTLASVVQVGPRFSFPAALSGDNGFNLGHRFGRLTSTERVIDAALACVKAALLISLLIGVLWEGLRGLMGLLQGTAERTLSLSAQLGGVIMVRAGAALVVVGAIDYLYQRYRFVQAQRMTREEMERERKETELDPRIKARGRRLHQQVAVRASSRLDQ
jgi:flagellar biosynthesis protein FlhB